VFIIFASTNTKTMLYYGIADQDGLESLNLPEWNARIEKFEINTRELSVLILRAQANRQRDAVVYKADVPVSQGKELNALFAKDRKSALKYLADNAKSIEIAKMPGSEKSWTKITN